MNRAELIKEAEAIAASNSAAIHIVNHVCSRAQFANFTDEQVDLVFQYAEAVRDGSPVQYVLGEWDFYGITMKINKSVLIPRPETELMVDQIAHDYAGGKHLRILDLGTGSGAIAIALKSIFPDSYVVGVDKSEDALEVARQNSTDVQWKLSDWFMNLATETFDIIVSNPPYIASEDAIDQIVKSNEPNAALFSGPDGLDDIRKIIAEAKGWLKPQGSLYVEHGSAQASSVIELAQRVGMCDSQTFRDLSGRPRWLRCQAP